MASQLLAAILSLRLTSLGAKPPEKVPRLPAKSPEKSPPLGDPVGQIGRSKLCFDAVGEPKELYERTIETQITNYLNKHFSSVPGNDRVTLSLYMVGQSEEIAVPTIIFIAKSQKTRKEARKAMKDCNVLSRFPAFQTEYLRRDPCCDSIEELASDGATTVDRPAIQVLYDASKSVRTLGQAIYIKHASSLRPATANVVRIGNQIFLQTVYHAFLRPLLYSIDSASSSAPKNDSEDDSTSDDEADDAEVAIMSKASATPDSVSDRASSSSGSSRRSSVFSASSTPKSRAQIPRQTDVKAILDDATTMLSPFAWSRRRHPATKMTALDPESLAPLGKLVHWSQEKDIALIEVTDPIAKESLRTALEASEASAYNRVARVSTGNAEVYAHTASGGRLYGTLSSRPTSTRLPNSRTFQKVHVVRLNGALANGDCGSAVIDVVTGETYGHLVAGCKSTGTAYILAAHQVLDVFSNVPPTSHCLADGLVACGPPTKVPGRLAQNLLMGSLIAIYYQVVQSLILCHFSMIHLLRELQLDVVGFLAILGEASVHPAEEITRRTHYVLRMPSRLLHWLDTNVVLNAPASMLMSLATLTVLDHRRWSFAGWLGDPDQIALHCTLARPPGYDVQQPPEPFLSPSILPPLFLVASVITTHWLTRVVVLNIAKTSSVKARSMSALAVILVAIIYTFQHISSPALAPAPRQSFTEGYSWLSVVLVTWLSIDYIPWARPRRFIRILRSIWQLMFLISIPCKGWLAYSSMNPQQLTSMYRYLNRAISCLATIASYLLMIHLVKSVTGTSLAKTIMIGPLVATLRKVALVISQVFQDYGAYICSIVLFVGLCTRILVLDDYGWPMLVLLITGMVHCLSISAGVWLNASMATFKLGLIFTIASVGGLINFRSYVEARNWAKPRPLLFPDLGTLDQKSTPLSWDIVAIPTVIVYSILSLATCWGVSGARYASTEPSWNPQSCSKFQCSPQDRVGSPVCTRPTVFLIGAGLLVLGYSFPLVFLPHTVCTLVYLAWRQKLHIISRRQMTVLFISILFGALLSVQFTKLGLEASRAPASSFTSDAPPHGWHIAGRHPEPLQFAHTPVVPQLPSSAIAASTSVLDSFQPSKYRDTATVTLSGELKYPQTELARVQEYFAAMQRFDFKNFAGAWEPDQHKWQATRELNSITAHSSTIATSVSNPSEQSLSIGIIVGVTVGGLLILTSTISVIVLLLWKKRRNNRDTKTDKGPRNRKATNQVRPYVVQLRSVPSYSNNNTVMSDTQSTLAGGTPSFEVHEGFRSDQERPHTNEMEVIVSSNPSRSRNLNAFLLRETENWKRKNSGNGPITPPRLFLFGDQTARRQDLRKLMESSAVEKRLARQQEQLVREWISVLSSSAPLARASDPVQDGPGQSGQKTTRMPSTPSVYVPTVAFFDPLADDVDVETVARHAVRLAKAGVAGIQTKLLDKSSRPPDDCRNSQNQNEGMHYALLVPPQYYRDIGRPKILDTHGESQQNRLDRSPGWTEHEPLNAQREPAYDPPNSCGLNAFLIAETENWKRKYPGSSVETGSSPSSRSEDKCSERPKIAIVGMSGRFPGASSNEEFWELLSKGFDTERPKSSNRFELDSHRPPSSERRLVLNVDYGTTFTGVSLVTSYPEPGTLPKLLDWAPIPKSDKVPSPINYRRAERSRPRPVVVKPEVIIDIGNRRRRPDEPRYQCTSLSSTRPSSYYDSTDETGHTSGPFNPPIRSNASFLRRNEVCHKCGMRRYGHDPGAQCKRCFASPHPSPIAPFQPTSHLRQRPLRNSVSDTSVKSRFSSNTPPPSISSVGTQSGGIHEPLDQDRLCQEMAERFRQALSTKRMNELASWGVGGCQRRTVSSAAGLNQSLPAASGSELRSASPPSYSSLRKIPLVPTPPTDSRSLRFKNTLQTLSSVPKGQMNYEARQTVITALSDLVNNNKAWISENRTESHLALLSALEDLRKCFWTIKTTSTSDSKHGEILDLLEKLQKLIRRRASGNSKFTEPEELKIRLHLSDLARQDLIMLNTLQLQAAVASIPDTERLSRTQDIEELLACMGLNSANQTPTRKASIIWEIGRATSAAPFYFDTRGPESSLPFEFIDGGVRDIESPLSAAPSWTPAISRGGKTQLAKQYVASIGTGLPGPSSKPGSSPSFCTFCGDSGKEKVFKTKQDWKRHCHDFHERSDWNYGLVIRNLLKSEHSLSAFRSPTTKTPNGNELSMLDPGYIQRLLDNLDALVDRDDNLLKDLLDPGESSNRGSQDNLRDWFFDAYMHTGNGKERDSDGMPPPGGTGIIDTDDEIGNGQEIDKRTVETREEQRDAAVEEIDSEFL